MTYRLTIAEKPGYLHATVTGRNSTENVARGCFRVLIEERLEGPRVGIMDAFRIVQEGSGRAHGAYQAIAYVDVNAVGDTMQFAETVAVNRGLPVTVFPTVAQAEQWLLKGQRA